ncbi:MAG: hypothetical protein WCO00_03365 [Rhodospirillaceae bacterium]
MATEIIKPMDPEKFAKVLAMAESDHHGEAQSALRAARIMLARAGLTFRDLAAMARESDGWPTPPVEQAAFVPTNVPGAGEETWRRKVRDLEARIRELEHTVEHQDSELIRQRSETRRWHLLARETAEKLWDVGQALEARQVRAAAGVNKRKQLIELLRDPATAALSDREISRRIGITPNAVGYWRWRIAVADRVRLQSRVAIRGRRLAQRFADGARP